MIFVELPALWRDRAVVLREEPAIETHATDLDSWFTADELRALDDFRLPKRRDEWLLSRIAAKHLALHHALCRDPRRCDVSRPRLNVDGSASWFISLSHSAPYAAAMIGQSAVGIDVQVVRAVSERAAHLFLSDEETATMLGSPLADRLLHFWCAKEAAWKQQGDEHRTLKQIPLQLEEERPDGLRFDRVETVRIGGVVVAITC